MAFRRPWTIPAAILFASLCAGAPRAQQPVFETGVDLVLLDVVVLDRDRKPVTGLTAADFSVVEDGERRDVQSFAAVSLPGPPAAAGAAWLREVAPDVATNAVAGEGRLAVILLDYSIPAGPMTGTARRIAHAAVDALGAGDLAAVVRSSPFTGEGLSQGFTADRQLLREAIDSPFTGLTKRPPDGATIGTGIDYVPDLDPESPDCPCGVCQWYALERVAHALEHVDRRHKAIFFIGRNILTNEAPTPDPKNTCDVRVSFARDRTLHALDRANVAVHSIDPSGLETLAATAGGGQRVPAAANLVRQDHLRVLPDYTGGRAVVGTNAPERALPGIFDETRHYYLIGFARAQSGRPGVRRNIRVRVNRPGVIVRSRTGYYPPSDADDAATAADASVSAASSLLPRTDLRLELGLIPRFAPDGTARVMLLLRLPESAAARAQNDAAVNGARYDVTIGVLDTRGNVHGSERQTIDVPPLPAGRVAPETLSYLALAPGRYEIRVGATAVTSGTSGSVHGHVSTAAADESPSLSGVLVELDGTATLTRTFRPGDRVAAIVQLRTFRQPDDATVRVRIVDAMDRVVMSTAAPIGRAGGETTQVTDARFDVPVDTLPDGAYLLTVETGTGNRLRARRVRFAVAR